MSNAKAWTASADKAARNKEVRIRLVTVLLAGVAFGMTQIVSTYLRQDDVWYWWVYALLAVMSLVLLIVNARKVWRFIQAVDKLADPLVLGTKIFDEAEEHGDITVYVSKQPEQKFIIVMTKREDQ